MCTKSMCQDLIVPKRWDGLQMHQGNGKGSMGSGRNLVFESKTVNIKLKNINVLLS